MQSLVTPIGYLAEDCGYCKDPTSNQRTPDSRASYWITSHSLTVDVYQELVDRGWRRSGTILYKPDVVRHCCPHYTIRLPAAQFTPIKDQRQTVNRWNRYVLGDDYIKEAAKLHPKSKEEKARQRTTFDLSAVIHESEYANVKRPPEPAHRFEVTLEPDQFSEEKFGLFANYQHHVHHESQNEISQSGFKRFLCNSPLKRETRTVHGKPQRLGSYHQCYRLDGRLIAMGVLDLLPHAVSGVYFLYHSDFSKWNFGKLGALRETSFALEEGYQYYYMGYYIHSCVKMRYKGDYKPQYVLDPESYEWNPLEGEMRKLLDEKPYVSLARERRARHWSDKSQIEDGQGEKGANEADEGSDQDFPLPEPADAAAAIRSGMSLFDLKVPGLMSPGEILRWGGLDNVCLRLSRGFDVPMKDLVAWDDGTIHDGSKLKGHVAELVACLGPVAAEQIAVTFR